MIYRRDSDFCPVQSNPPDKQDPVLATMLPTSPYYGSSAPPYHGGQQADPERYMECPPQPAVHGMKQPGLHPQAVHFQNCGPFESVDLESGPNSPPAQVNRPMMPTVHTSQPTSVEDQGTSSSLPNKRRPYRWLLYGVAIGLVVIFASVITAVLMMHFGPQRQPIPSELHTNCVSCDFLQEAMSRNSDIIPNAKDLEVKVLKTGGMLCCLKPSEGTQQLLQKFLEQVADSAKPLPPRPRVQNKTLVAPPQTSQEAVARTASRNQAAAFVGLEKRLPHISDNEVYTLKEWDTQSNSAMYIRPQMHYSPATGHFTVPFDGLYNINIHLSLVNHAPGSKTKEFGLRLVRYNRDLPQLGNQALALDKEVVPHNEHGTSSLTLTVHLRRHDELFTQVSPVSLVIEDNTLSFFCIVFESA